ncbi:hypothetical protein CDAR_409231 [Caerostris darwini]|uniref:Uncharacterized protein n=1 Tax=Caerostris darwini TaxID=1538125 RepID=A0AAV4PCR3_9ARAC|nr:hypothetical protein CDAR_409231 [Caerostris darwini]
MRLLTKLDQLRYLASSETVGSCVPIKSSSWQRKWGSAALIGRMEVYNLLYCHGHLNTAWAWLQYWTSSHRLKIDFFSNMGDGSRKALWS